MERYSYKQEPNPSEYGLLDESALYSDDSGSFLSKGSADTIGNNEDPCLNVQNSTDHSKELADSTSESEPSTSRKNKLTSICKKAVSEFTIVDSAQKSSVLIQIGCIPEVLFTDQEHIFSSGVINLLKQKRSASIEDYMHISTDGSSLVSNLTEFFSKYVRVSSQSSTETRKELLSLDEDKTNFFGKQSAQSIEPKSDLTVRDQESLNPPTNYPSTTNTADITDPMQPSDAKENNLIVSTNSSTTLLNDQKAEFLKFLSTSFTLANKSIYNSSKMKSSGAFPNSYSNYNSTLQELRTRMDKLKKNLDFDKKAFSRFVTAFSNLVVCTSEILRSQFLKSKRNVCIQSIYKRKANEVLEFLRIFLSLMDESLKFTEDNYGIQLDNFSTFLDKYNSDYRFCFKIESLENLVKAMNSLKTMDSLRCKRLDKNFSTLLNHAEKIRALVNSS